MQIYDGPINVQNCTFRKYIALDGRHTSAFGFRLNNSWQSCPNNNVTDITFDDVPVSSTLERLLPAPPVPSLCRGGICSVEYVEMSLCRGVCEQCAD